MAINEGFVLNGLDLNNGPKPSGDYGLEALDLTPPRKRSEWVQSADNDGAVLLRKPPFDNRLITAKVRIEPQTTMDAALEKLGAIIDQLQEAEKNPGGIPLVWTPSQGTKKLTFYLLHGEVVGLPINVAGELAGWFAKTPVLTLALTCKPFGYGEEVEASAGAIANTTGLSIVTLTLPSVAGDVAAEGRLVVKDTAGVGRRYVEWGIENRYYNAATSLVLDSEDMTPVGGAQNVTLAGAYKRPGATNSSIVTTLLPEPTICCNTGVLKHVGTFRVKARIRATLGGSSEIGKVHIRLGWQDGEGPIRSNLWQTPNLGGSLIEVDLGTITVSPAALGSQKWLGQIEAYSENTAAADVLHVDYLTLIPVEEGYGKARGVQPSTSGAITAFDNFTTGVLSGSLNAHTPPVGAAWATSGAATDWTVGTGKITRATKDTEPRYGLIGAAVGNSAITISAEVPYSPNIVSNIVGGVLRWVDANNYVFWEGRFTGQGTGTAVAISVRLGVKVAGVTTILAVKGNLSNEHRETPAFITATLTATLDGVLSLTGEAWSSVSAPKTFSLSAQSSAVATGGALASGKAGIWEQAALETITRAFTLVRVNAASVPYCIAPSRALEVHSDSTITQDTTGTYYGPVPLYRGSRFYVPQDGSANRTSRIIVKADRNDLEEADQQTIADGFTAQVFVTPRYHVIPR